MRPILVASTISFDSIQFCVATIYACYIETCPIKIVKKCQQRTDQTQEKPFYTFSWKTNQYGDEMTSIQSLHHLIGIKDSQPLQHSQLVHTVPISVKLSIESSVMHVLSYLWFCYRIDVVVVIVAEAAKMYSSNNTPSAFDRFDVQTAKRAYPFHGVGTFFRVIEHNLLDTSNGQMANAVGQQWWRRRRRRWWLICVWHGNIVL